MRRRFAASENLLSPDLQGVSGDCGIGPAPLTATELLDAWAELDLLRAKMLEEMSEYPVLLCPVASVPAWKHGERTWTIEGRRLTTSMRCGIRSGSTRWRAPAAVVPVGRSPEGLPIGVQIAARPFEDEMALGVAAIVDAAFGYPAAGDGARLNVALSQCSQHRESKMTIAETPASSSEVKFIHHRQMFIAPSKNGVAGAVRR